MPLIKTEQTGTLAVRIYDTRAEMGYAAGNDAADVIVSLLEKKAGNPHDFCRRTFAERNA